MSGKWAATTRCMWIDDDGNPIRRGCKAGGKCGFAHPEDPEWATAQRRKMASDAYTKPREDTRERYVASGSRDHKDFDMSSWDSKKGKERETDSGWGSTTANQGIGSWARPRDKADDDPGQWGKAQDTSGWGPAASASTANDGWGTVNDEGWGGGGWAKQVDTSGWGDIVNSWGAPPPTIPAPLLPTRKTAPDTPTVPAVPLLPTRKASLDKVNHSTPTMDPRKAKERATSNQPPNIQTDAPSPSLSNLDKGKATSSRPHAKHDLNKPGPSTTGTLSTPVVPMGPPPGPLASASTIRAMKAPTAPVPAVTSKELLNNVKALKRTSLRPEEMKAKISIMRAGLTPEQRAEVYLKVIKIVQHLVYLRLRVKKLEDNDTKWSRLQKDKLYGNSTFVTRDKLEVGRTEAYRRLQTEQSTYRAALRELVSLPDIPAQSTRTYNPALDREKLVKYTLELKAWAEDLDIPKRVNALRIAHSQPPAKPNPPNTSPDATTDSDSFPPRQGLTVEIVRGEIDFLENSTAYLRDRIEEWDTIMDSVDEELEQHRKENLQKMVERQVANQVEAEEKRLATMDQKINGNGRAACTAVKEKRESVRAMIEDLKQRRASIEHENAALERAIQEAEARHSAHTALVDEFAKQVRALATRSSAPRPVREITIDDIAPEIRAEIINKLKAELQPVLEGLVSLTNHAGEEVKAKLEKMVEPLLQKAADITRRAQATTAQ